MRLGVVPVDAVVPEEITGVVAFLDNRSMNLFDGWKFPTNGLSS